MEVIGIRVDASDGLYLAGVALITYGLYNIHAELIPLFLGAALLLAGFFYRGKDGEQ